MAALAEPVHRLDRRWVLGTWFVLGLCVGAAALLSAASPASALVTAGLFIPWLLPLRGLLRGDRRTHAWATLCVAPYFVYGVTETVANPAVRAAAAAILFASFAHFVALVVYLRATRSQELNQAGPSP
jgi:uncharacterized membrane protein